MRTLEFRGLLDEAVGIADGLTGPDGAAGGAFAAALSALEELLGQLVPYTRPGGGKLELDSPAYQGEGGGGLPAFMRDAAFDLLNVATVLQRAREEYWALDGPDPDAAYEAGDEASTAPRRRDRADLRYPHQAPTGYTADEVRKVQKLFRFLYSRRAYATVRKGGIWRRALSEGRVSDKCEDIVALSRRNLSDLRRFLRPLSRDEQALYLALYALPFRIKHATASAHRDAIANVGMLWSLQRLRDWYVVPTSQFTTASDKYQKGDYDFVFFRLEVGEDAIDTRYGDLQFVFRAGHIFEDGWVTLHDMLAPIDSPTLQTLRLRYAPDTVVRRSRYLDDEHWWHTEWEHEHCDPEAPGAAPRLVHILDEVFYGPDIREGLIRSILRDLRDVPSLQAEAFAHCEDAGYLRWLIGVLYRVEAKYPSGFRFDADTLLREHHKPAQRAAVGAVV